MKFCSNCGGAIVRRMPEGDSRERDICSSCDTIFYQNPNIVVGTLPVYCDKILLCKRAIEPRKGFWTLPGGFMENGESSLDGALRESWEEACIKLANVSLYRLFDLPYINQVYMFYRGEIINGEYAIGQESLDVQLFDAADIPWDDLAFRVVDEMLTEFLQDRTTGQYPVRVSTLSRRAILTGKL